MHAFLHGIILYVIKIILSLFNTAGRESLDNLVDKTLVTVCSSERTNYPKCSFTCGISNLKLLTAIEWAGIALAVDLDYRRRIEVVHQNVATTKNIFQKK